MRKYDWVKILVSVCVFLSAAACGEETVRRQRVIQPPAPPTDDRYDMLEDQLLDVSLSEGVLANDLGAAPGAVGAVLVQDVQNGALVLAHDGSFSYTPTENWNGDDTFTYRRSDSEVATEIATVTIAVGAVEDPPVALDDSYAIDEDQVLNVQASEGLLANDQNGDGGTLSVTVHSDAAHGAVVLNGDGSFIYTPDLDFHGADNFAYRATDSVTALVRTVRIEVRPINDAPRAQEVTLSVVVNSVTRARLRAPDAEGDSVTFRIDTVPTHGQASVVPDTGMLTYTPDADYLGPDTLTFIADDGTLDSAATAVTVAVVPVPPPTIDSLYPTFGTTGVPLQLFGTTFGATPGSATVDGRPATVGMWAPTRVVITVPVDFQAGIYDVVLTEADSRGDTGTAIYEIRPWIQALSPNVANEGEHVTLTGDAFGAAAGAVDVGGTNATIVSWSNLTIVFEVPAGLARQSPNVRVTTAAAEISNQFGMSVRGTDYWVLEDTPRATQSHQSYWSGTDMLTWFSADDAWRYEPRTDLRIPMSNLGAPATGNSVWTGTQLIVFGPDGGGIYNAFDDTWNAISGHGMPVGGKAVWTGQEMLVWGATVQLAGQAARYNPQTDLWAGISGENAPTPRTEHIAVWAGDSMFVWGGYDGSLVAGPQDGAMYNPGTDSWTAVAQTNAPDPRRRGVAVWTGSEVLVWGGADPNAGVQSGGRYDPFTESWTTMATTGAPLAGRDSAAVWTGTEMVVWGGDTFNRGRSDEGGRYNPMTDTWAITTSADVPPERSRHSVCWTGTNAIVWGGYDTTLLTTGGLYSATSNTWMPMLSGRARAARGSVWSGTELITLGEASSRFDPEAGTWTAASPQSIRVMRYSAASVIWTGSEVILWGGTLSTAINTGVRYNPSTDMWAAVTTNGAPAGRYGHAAVWTGSEMLVWGGHTGSQTSYTSGIFLSDGARYDPVTDSWTAMISTGAPQARKGATAVWTGSEMLVWGGTKGVRGHLGTGARYHPGDGTTPEKWSTMSTNNSLSARRRHSMVWTGSVAILWGGRDTASLADGATYDPSRDLWQTITNANTPPARADHVAVWTGSEMLIWGGRISDGGAYDPSMNAWRWFNAANSNASPPSNASFAAWSGTEMLVVAGDGVTSRYVP